MKARLSGVRSLVLFAASLGLTFCSFGPKEYDGPWPPAPEEASENGASAEGGVETPDGGTAGDDAAAVDDGTDGGDAGATLADDAGESAEDSGGGEEEDAGSGAGGAGGFDAGAPAPHKIGGGCTSDEECVVGLTCDLTMPGGMCTKACNKSKDCGGASGGVGNVCVSTQCYRGCSPTLACTRNAYPCTGLGSETYCGPPNDGG